MKQQVILLNGPSSSGKSTVAKALRELILAKRGERYAVVSIDDFLPMTAQDAIYEDDVFAVSPALCAAVVQALRTGDGVIVDHVITSQRIFEQLTDSLGEHPLRLIRITCPPTVLRERETARGDRCPGSAEASAAWLFPKEGYDLTVDTHGATAEDCAARIFAYCFAEHREDGRNRT